MITALTPHASGFRRVVAVCVMCMMLAACGGAAAPTATTARGSAPAASVAPTAPTAAGSPTTAAAVSTSAPAASAAMPTTATGATPSAPAMSAPNLTLPATAKRGDGGNLRLLWWQAPTILNPHLSQGTKDFDASRVVLEPLATISSTTLPAPDVPVLAKEIPSTANGELAADGTSVTWKLRDGVLWSDGEKLTADDVVFTWQFVTNKANGATTAADYDTVKDVTAVDPTTVKITFAAPTPVWYLPFVGSRGDILPKHYIQACMDAKNCPANLKPIGTGPYVVTDFKPGDTVLYKANEKFREANAPYFATVEMKGGGDAVTAVKALQTGQVDFAWNPQVGPDILKQLTDSGQVLAVKPGTSAETIYVNFADPSIEVNGEKSSPQSKSPFWSDKMVRQALALAIDRDAMAKNLYGPAGASGNSTIPSLWAGTAWQYDPKKANDLLDAAGWKMGSDGVRAKDGKKFAITFRTSVNSVRDKESQLIKSNLKDIGIAVELRPVDSSVFFGQPDNADARARFETDLEMLTDGTASPDMQGWLSQFTTDKIAAKANGWKGTNHMRWSNPEYDATIKELNTTLDPVKRQELFKKADGIITSDYALIPLVARTSLTAYAKGLDGVNPGSWDSNVWNIAHWSKK